MKTKDCAKTTVSERIRFIIGKKCDKTAKSGVKSVGMFNYLYSIPYNYMEY